MDPTRSQESILPFSANRMREIDHEYYRVTGEQPSGPSDLDLETEDKIDPALWETGRVESAAVEHAQSAEVPRAALTGYILQAGDILSHVRDQHRQTAANRVVTPGPSWGLQRLAEMFTGRSDAARASVPTVRSMIRAEIKANEYIFGSFDPKYPSEFFLHESDGQKGASWVVSSFDDNDNQVVSRYEYRGGGFKFSSDNSPYRDLSDRELVEFYQLVNRYYETSMQTVYGLDPRTAQPYSVASQLQAA